MAGKKDAKKTDKPMAKKKEGGGGGKAKKKVCIFSDIHYKNMNRNELILTLRMFSHRYLYMISRSVPQLTLHRVEVVKRKSER